MVGYIFLLENFDKSSVLNELFVPGHTNESLYRETIGDYMSFGAWGTGPGDVYYSINTDHSLLILNGYISEAKSIQAFRSQKEACDSLLECFDRNHSIEYCSRIANQIYGSFSIVYANLEEKRVFCITDRVSSRPIWASKTRNGWIISSHVSPIASTIDKNEYDLGALGALFLYGCLVEPTKSIYKGITAVEEGTVMVCPMSRDSTKYHWYNYRHKPDKTLSYREWVDLACQRLSNASRRILNGSSKPMIFLSGGIDSRLTASALRYVGGNPILVTMGDQENLEIKVAKKAASALKCQHEIILRDPHWYLRSLPNYAYETGGCYNWKHGHFSEAYRKCKEDFETDSAMLGDFCEAFSKLFCVVPKSRKQIWTSQDFLKEFDGLSLPLYRPLHRDITLNLFSSKVRNELVEELHKDIVDRYNRVCDVSTDPRIVADYFFRWQSASTLATFFMFIDVRSAGPERSLMFDKDVHQLLEILPASMRDGADLGAKLIRRLWPPAAMVANSNSLLPLYLPSRVHSAAKFIRPSFGRLRRRFFDNSYITTDSWPKRSLLYTGDQKWRTFFESIVGESSLFNNDIFDLEAIKSCWYAFCKGDSSFESDIEKLVGVGVLNLQLSKDQDNILRYKEILSISKG